MPVAWGGKDDYDFSFVPENQERDESKYENGDLHVITNNNSEEQADINLLHRKVGQTKNILTRKKKEKSFGINHKFYAACDMHL